MNGAKRELLVARILSGYVRLKLHDNIYQIGTPTPHNLYIANEIYDNVFREAYLHNCLSEDELILTLVDQNLWSGEKEEQVTTLRKNIEDLKVSVFEHVFKSNARERARRALNHTRDKLAHLLAIKYHLSHYSAESVGGAAKFKFLIGSAIQCNGKQYWANPEQNWEKADVEIEEVITEYGRTRLDEQIYRELARTEPWRSIWGLRECGRGVFPQSSCEFSEEQAGICIWSKIFDNVVQHSEAPHESIIEDDDMLDGWMILQRRKRESDQNKKRGHNILSKNKKIREANEVFIIADTLSDAKKIDDMNDNAQKFIKRQRMMYLNKQGEVNEVNMPDTKQKIRTQITKLVRDKAKRK